MNRTFFLPLVLGAAACSGSSKPDQTLVGGPSPENQKHVEAADVPTPAKPTVVADATPDAPSSANAKREAELATNALGFIDAFNNFEPVFSRDGKQLVFASNRDGIPQLYVGDVGKPDAPATRLVTTTERITGAVVTPDGKSVVYQSDTGADENWRFYRVGLDGKDPIELTPGEVLNRDGFVIPDGKPDALYFSARKMSESKSTVYVTSSIKAGEPRPIFTDDKPAFLTDVSRDGKRAVVQKYPARTENYVVVVDTATGKANQIYPASGKVSVFDAKFSPDGKKVYVATDGGAEQALVLALDPKTGKVLAKHELQPPTAQILGFAVAKKGGLIAVSALVGNHAEIRLLDGAKLTPKTEVQMPLGNGFATEFTDDGKQLAAQWSTPQIPNDVFAIDTRTGKAEPLRKEDRPTLAGMPTIEATIVEIPAFDGGKIPTNVYMPAGEQGKKHPVIVSYHGGPSGVSTIRWNASTAYFLSLGYIVVEPNVRGSGGFGRAFESGDNGAKRLDAFKDIETSARWVAKQPWADAGKLVVYGGSYGGYTVLIALSRWPDIWKAGVNLFGVVNLETFMKTTSGVIREIFLVEFGDPEKDAAFLTQISPSTDAAKIVDPTFVYAGANDPRVPRTESDLIVKTLRGNKVATEYMVADNEGHSLARKETQVAFFSRAARFLEQHLK